MAGVSDQRATAVRSFACNLGLCFQVLDDLADAHDHPEPGGTPTGEDQHKTTFVSLMGPERARAFSEQLAGEAKASLEPLGQAAAPLSDFADYVLGRNRRFTPQR